MVKNLPRKGTHGRRIYEVLAEYPGIEFSAQEIADEVDLPLRLASAHACILVKRGQIQKVVDRERYRNLYLIEDREMTK